MACWPQFKKGDWLRRGCLSPISLVFRDLMSILFSSEMHHRHMELKPFVLFISTGIKMTVRKAVVEILDPVVVEILRQKTPAERLTQAFRMWETARLMTRSSVRQQYPDWNDEQVFKEAAKRLSHGMTERVSQ